MGHDHEVGEYLGPERILVRSSAGEVRAFPNLSPMYGLNRADQALSASQNWGNHVASLAVKFPAFCNLGCPEGGEVLGCPEGVHLAGEGHDDRALYNPVCLLVVVGHPCDRGGLVHIYPQTLRKELGRLASSEDLAGLVVRDHLEGVSRICWCQNGRLVPIQGRRGSVAVWRFWQELWQLCLILNWYP